LNVETLNYTPPPAEGDKREVNVFELLTPYITFALLVAMIFAAVVYARKRKGVEPSS
jgi:hypothetical protein